MYEKWSYSSVSIKLGCFTRGGGGQLMKLCVFIGNLNLGNCELGEMEYTNIGRFSFSEAQTLYPQLTAA